MLLLLSCFSHVRLCATPWTAAYQVVQARVLSGLLLPSPENPMSSMKRQKGMTLKDEFPGSVGAQYATGDQWRNKKE